MSCNFGGPAGIKIQNTAAIEICNCMAAVWRSYDDNNNGILDYRKFVAQVMSACVPAPLP